MLIECMIDRGGESVRVQVQRNAYDFIRNDEGKFVCNVLAAGHAEHLLKHPSDFRIYVEEQKEPEVKVELKTEEKPTERAKKPVKKVKNDTQGNKKLHKAAA